MAGRHRRTLPFLLAVTPLFTLNVCYLLSVHLDVVPSCVPYIDGCTSTSSTGRALLPRLFFLPGMLLTSILVALFWRQCARQVAESATGQKYNFAIQWMGFIAAFLLAIYALLIGQVDDILQSIRRVGSNGFFILNYAAQLWFLAIIIRGRVGSRAVKVTLMALVSVLPLLAITGEFAKSAGADRGMINNIVEWNGIVLVCMYYAVAGFVRGAR